MGSSGDGVQGIRKALAQLKRRLATTESLQASLAEFSSSFPWQAQRPIAELAVSAESVRKIAGDLLTAQNTEQNAKAAHTSLTKRMDDLQRQLSDIRPKLARFAAAHEALERLQKEHSLKAAMEVALKENRESIESIFSRIHSPLEFAGLGSTITTLVRKSDGKEAKLSEISTGQRAAFGLSIFLAKTVSSPQHRQRSSSMIPSPMSMT